MARALLLALMMGASAPAIALADTEAEKTAEEVAEEHEEGGHAGHDGPVTIEGILHDTHFWAAVINFTLLLIVLRKLGGKGISEFLKSRRATMEASINEAAEIKAKAEAKHEEYSARLKTLDAELAKLKADLEAAAVSENKRISAEAEEASKRARAETDSLIEQHAQALAAEVRREVVEAAVLAAQQVIAGSVNPGDQQKLADGFRERIETLASKAGRVSSRAPMGGQS
jgi:F0F1-type ATP synthase membrane subunit b/b'